MSTDYSSYNNFNNGSFNNGSMYGHSHMGMTHPNLASQLALDASLASSTSSVGVGPGLCLCQECEYYRMWGTPTSPSVSSLPSTPTMAPQQPRRKYSHNPYAPAQPTTPSTPPVVTAGDAIASIVPNVAEYDIYSGMYPPMAAPQQPQMHHSHHHHGGMPQHHANNMMMHHHNGHMGNVPQHHMNMNGMNMNGMNMNMGMGSSSNVPTAGYTLHEQFAASIGMIVDHSTTARGRSMLQAVLRLRQPDHVAAIFSEITAAEDTVSRLMLDPNACHVIRALIEAVDAADIQPLAGASVMTESIVLQLATTSQHTRRILQSLFERFSMEKCCEEVTAILATHAEYLAGTQQGCIALMRVIDNATPSQRSAIHTKLFPTMATMAMDPYGNYVIQHMVERGDVAEVSEAVATHFVPMVVPMCCNKFASNVMEKVFYAVTPAARRALLDTILYTNNALHTLMHDNFGNFVVQASIDSCVDAAEFRRIAERMRPLIHTSPYGHKIEAKLKSKRLNHRGPNVQALGQQSSTSSACDTAPHTPTSMALESPILAPQDSIEDLAPAY